MGFLKSFFDPSRNKVWSSVAQDIGGEYIDPGFWSRKAVAYQHREWDILLDCYPGAGKYSCTTYTRMRAPFMTKGNLLFKINRNTQIIETGKVLEYQLVETGDPAFDKQYVIKGNQAEPLQHLLQCPTLKRLLNKQPSVHFEIREDEAVYLNKFPQGVDLLYFQVATDILNKQRLKDLFELFTVTLDRLVQIDSAYTTNPGFSLRNES